MKRLLSLLFSTFIPLSLSAAHADYGKDMPWTNHPINHPIDHQMRVADIQLDQLQALIDQNQMMAQAAPAPLVQEHEMAKQLDQLEQAEPSLQEATQKHQQPYQPVTWSRFFKRQEFEFAKEVYWVKYKEPDVMRQGGIMNGYKATYTFHPDFKEIDMVRLQAQWASGKFNYHSDDGLADVKGKKDTTFEIRGVFGKDFYDELNRVTWTPYMGYGFRYLKDAGEDQDVLAGSILLLGYNRYSNYHYLPIGIDVKHAVSKHIDMQANLEYDVFLRGLQTSNLGVLPGYGTIKNKQTQGYGLRSGLRFNMNLKHYTLFAEGFMHYWSIGESKKVEDPTDPAFEIYEPKNTTREIGLRFGAKI